MSSVQTISAVPPIPTVDGMIRDRRRDRWETDRLLAPQRTVEEGQYRRMVDPDDKTACASRVHCVGGCRRKNRCSASRRRWIQAPGDRIRSYRVGGYSGNGSCILTPTGLSAGDQHACCKSAEHGGEPRVHRNNLIFDMSRWRWQLVTGDRFRSHFREPAHERPSPRNGTVCRTKARHPNKPTSRQP